jgi:hypothetical protein
MNKWEKLITLHRLLAANRHVPGSRILEELACSRQTFHRLRGFIECCFHAPVVYSKRYRGCLLHIPYNDPHELNAVRGMRSGSLMPPTRFYKITSQTTMRSKE